MDERLKLSIGAWNTEPPASAPKEPVHSELPPDMHVADSHYVTKESPSPTGESLAQIYEILRRHEETLRDLIIEVRLLYYTLPEKDRQRLESLRARITHEVRDLHAGQLRLLEERVSRAPRA